MPRSSTLFFTTCLLIAGLAACAPPEPAVEFGAAEDRAVELARSFLIIDTHIDVPYRLMQTDRGADVGEATEGGHFDHPRAVAGGLDLPFLSIYVPASYQESGGAKEYADELIDLVEGIAQRHPEKFAIVTDVTGARETFAAGKIGLALGMENGAPIEDDLANVAHFAARGVRYITLTHSKDNRICDSSYDETRTWGGLSPFGRELVAEMNRLGMMIDISHVTDDAAHQVLELTRAPVIASHSSCRHFTPGWQRNMGDETIRRLAENGGVIQINFGSAFITQAAQEQQTPFWKAIGDFQAENELVADDPRLKQFEEEYWAGREQIRGTVRDVADHIDHVVEIAGIDHVGIGSDYDGVSTLPEGLDDVSGYPNLIRELLDRGYTEEEVEKICSGNLIRVWTEVERLAAEAGAAG